MGRNNWKRRRAGMTRGGNSGISKLIWKLGNNGRMGV